MSPRILLVAAATLLPICYYVIVGLRRASRPTDLDDYFIYGRRVRANDFANTAIGYSLQTAALFLFADWGIRYGLGAFWVPLFWGLGFLFIYWSIPRLHRFLANGWTLHGYLNARSGSHALQIIAASATLIGLWGTMMVELDYATSIFQPLLPHNYQILLLRAAFLIFSTLYIGYGGYKAEVNTERVQLPVAYVAFITVTIILLWNVGFRGQDRLFTELCIMLLALFLLMIGAKFYRGEKGLWRTTQALIPIGGLLATGFMLVSHFLRRPGILLDSGNSVFTHAASQLAGPGALALISLFLSNALWQFVDISSWQRLASVDVTSTEASAHFSQMRAGLWRTMIESPVSWGFGILFGMSLRYGGFLPEGHDPSEAISNFATAVASPSPTFAFLGKFNVLIYPIFISAIVAVMLSTINALSSAITFTAFRDFPPYGKSTNLSLARLYTVSIVIVGAVIYLFLRQWIGVGIQTALYSFYSAQLALFPTVVASLTRKSDVKPTAAIVSILGGIAATFTAAVVIAKMAPDSYLLPPLATFVVSFVLYYLVSLAEKRSTTSPT